MDILNFHPLLICALILSRKYKCLGLQKQKCQWLKKYLSLSTKVIWRHREDCVALVEADL